MDDEAQVKKAMAGWLKRPVERLGDDVLLTDLVTDSFMLVELVIELQSQLTLRLVQDDLAGVRTVGDLTAVMAAKQAGAGSPSRAK